MSEIGPILDVYCFGELAGRLGPEYVNDMAFAYEPAWTAAGRPPLSHALPPPVPPPAAVEAFFSGLLPEAEPRRRLARRLGVSEQNDLALLAAIGGDCPGAITLVSHGAEPPRVEHGADVEWLDDAGLAELIATLHERPMLADQEGEIRLSLAGAQDKLPVLVGDDGRVGITAGLTPSTHVLKTPIERLDGTVVNEAFCLALGRRLGIPTVEATPRRAGGRSCLLVTRYDRAHTADGVMRLHQEDFCQALGVRPERKYEAEGGPSVADCFALVRAATSVPALELPLLLDALGLSFLVGNHDAHAKNLSLLYSPTDVVLAPFYDIVSTVVYRGLSRKGAMKIGGEYRPEYVQARHLDRMLREAELGAVPGRRRLHALAREAPAAAHATRRELADAGWDGAPLETIVAIVERRARQLAEIAAPVRRTASR